MPNWTPGSMNGIPVRVQYTLPINFLIEGKATNSKSIYNGKNEGFDERYKNMEVFYSPFYQGNIADDFYNSNAVELSEENLEKASIEQVNYYVFNTAKLGWINCDRFNRTNQTLVNFTVKSRNHSKNMDVKLIFKNIRSVIAGRNNGNSFTFENVPLNEPVILYAIKFENGQYYIATLELIINKSGVTQFKL